jgi:hypothetical protein
MFPLFDGKSVPHLEEALLEHLTPQDLVLLKLVNKAWAAKISRWLRKCIASGKLDTNHLMEAWSTPVKNPFFLSIHQRVLDLQVSPGTGNLLFLDKMLLSEYRSGDFVRVSANALPTNRYICQHEPQSNFKTSGNLILVNTWDGSMLFEMINERCILHCGSHHLGFGGKRDIAFNGKFIIGHPKRPVILEVADGGERDGKLLKNWDRAAFPECLRRYWYLTFPLVAIDESSGNFAVFTMDDCNVHILDGKNLLCMKSCKLDDVHSHLESMHKMLYRHPYVVTRNDECFVVHNVESGKITASPPKCWPNNIDDMLITQDNVLLYMVISPWSGDAYTSVFSCVLGPEKATAPQEIMRLEKIRCRQLRVFGTRIVLMHYTSYGQFDDTTIIVGDVWNQNSVPRDMDGGSFRLRQAASSDTYDECYKCYMCYRVTDTWDN